MKNEFFLILSFSLVVSTFFSQSNHRQNFSHEYWEKYLGIYSNELDKYSLSLTWGSKFVLTDLLDGSIEIFEEKSENNFVASDSSKFSFDENEYLLMRVLHGDSSVVLKKNDMQIEELTIVVDNGEISGTLLIPDGEVPHSLIIVNGGASWIIRDTNLDEALFYVSEGIAAFIYDKRGWGESTGQKTVPFKTTANDIVEIANNLKFRMDINPSKIGISTYSQSGWYGTLASAKSDIISFQILNVPSATFVYRQEEQRVLSELTVDGFDENEIRNAMRLFNLMSNFSITGQDWDTYIKFRNENKDKDWFKYLFAPDNKNEETWEWGRMNWTYNPLPALLKNKIPTLVILGEKDKKVLPEVNQAIFEMVFDAAENLQSRIVVIEDMNHSLMISPTGGREDKTLMKYARRMFEEKRKWIKEYVLD